MYIHSGGGGGGGVKSFVNVRYSTYLEFHHDKGNINMYLSEKH